ncbi:hypothetical protein, partial [Nonomuraea terrae]|uniref:hypothetical protein n=1 Tax=Nonomuraea terrae TaxID=2530383 RepID=UPI001CB714A1
PPPRDADRNVPDVPSRDAGRNLPDIPPQGDRNLPDAPARDLPAVPAVRGRHPFTPPSRTRAFRGGAYGDKLVYTVSTKGESNGEHRDGALIRYGGIDLTAGGDGDRWQEFWRDPPQDDDSETGAPLRVVARLGLVMGVALLAAGLVWAVMNAREHPVTITKAAAQTSVLLERPSRWVAEVTAPQAAGSAMTPVPRKADLPRPDPPVARLSPSSLWLGPERTGSFRLSCTGSCEITSVSATDGIEVSGTRFRVQEPMVCVPGVERGEITLRWEGRTTGDGRRTGGTATGGGTLTLDVAWSRCG